MKALIAFFLSCSLCFAALIGQPLEDHNDSVGQEVVAYELPDIQIKPDGIVFTDKIYDISGNIVGTSFFKKTKDVLSFRAHYRYRFNLSYRAMLLNRGLYHFVYPTNQQTWKVFAAYYIPKPEDKELFAKYVKDLNDEDFKIRIQTTKLLKDTRFVSLMIQVDHKTLTPEQDSSIEATLADELTYMSPYTSMVLREDNSFLDDAYLNADNELKNLILIFKMRNIGKTVFSDVKDYVKKFASDNGIN
jgi:hypothetical protein